MAEKVFEFIVSDDGADKRIDVYLSKALPELSRNRIQKLIEDGYVRVNNDIKKNPSLKLKPQKRITVTIPEIKPLELIPLEIPLDIKYEDPHLLIINKPAGMVVHPGAGNEKNTLVNALIFHCKELSGIGGVERPGIVHRLDKDTSGLLIVAKDDLTHRRLTELFKERKIQKTYHAITHGVITEKMGLINRGIARHPLHRKKMSVSDKNSREAITIWKAIESFKNASFLEIEIKTGRTHQIRVHLSSIGHPILGDALYGGHKKISINDKHIGLQRHMLHAGKLIFTHPVNNKLIEIKANIPDDMRDILNLLRQNSS